jgi:hypothetical protein
MLLWLLISVDDSLFEPFTNGLYVLRRYSYMCLIISPAFVIQDGTQVAWYSVFTMLLLVWRELWATPFCFEGTTSQNQNVQNPLWLDALLLPLFALFVKTCGAVYTQSTRSLNAVYTRSSRSTRSLHAFCTQLPLSVVSCERICLDQVFLWPRLLCCFLYWTLTRRADTLHRSTLLPAVFYVLIFIVFLTLVSQMAAYLYSHWFPKLHSVPHREHVLSQF